jgi:carbamoyl-phosphate synthase small subunit
MEGLDLVPQVTTATSYSWSQGCFRDNGFPSITESELAKRPHCVALDFGIKYNILRLLTEHGFRVTVVPATTSSAEILKLAPDGIFISNGPGDPAAVTYGVQTVKELLGKRPMFGICLGNQILGLAAGIPTYKLKFGHRGANHPVRFENSGKIEITVQNHGFAVDATKIPTGVRVTHVNLNDQTVEGLEIPEARAFAVQYHPESSPGPHDSNYHFKRFSDLVQGAQVQGTQVLGTGGGSR